MANYKSLKENICRDKNDDEILALSRVSNSRYVITGNQDLLVLKNSET